MVKMEMLTNVSVISGDHQEKSAAHKWALHILCVYNANCKKFTNISTDLPFAEQILSN